MLCVLNSSAAVWVKEGEKGGGGKSHQQGGGKRMFLSRKVVLSRVDDAKKLDERGERYYHTDCRAEDGE